MTLIGLLISLLLDAFAIACLSMAWRNSQPRHFLALLTGWLSLALGLMLGYLTFLDTGLAISVAGTIVFALAGAIWFNRAELAQSNHRRNVPRRKPATLPAQVWTRGQFATTAVYCALAGPGSVLTALLVSLAVYRLLCISGAAETDAIMAGFCAVPLTVCLLSSQVLVELRWLKSAILQTALALSSLGLLFRMGPVA